MSNDINTGANKLIERILESAHDEAKKIASEAEESCAQAREQAERLSAASKEAFVKQRDDAVKAVMERSRTNAELYARKEALDKRRLVLDRVFGEAYDALCAYDDNKRGAVIENMILREAEGGEEIYPAHDDRELIQSLLPAVNEKLVAKGKEALKLSGEDASGMKRGFTLAGSGFMKDCSFRALLRDARMAEETNVSGILFN